MDRLLNPCSHMRGEYCINEPPMQNWHNNTIQHNTIQQWTTDVLTKTDEQNVVTRLIPVIRLLKLPLNQSYFPPFYGFCEGCEEVTRLMTQNRQRPTKPTTRYDPDRNERMNIQNVHRPGIEPGRPCGRRAFYH